MVPRQNNPVTNNKTLHRHGTREHKHAYPEKLGLRHQHGKSGLFRKTSLKYDHATGPTITATVSPITPPSSPRRNYICNELSTSEANSLYLSGHDYLDRDNDGIPCEPYTTPYIRPTTRSQSFGTSGYFVNGYTLSSGPYVRGHQRCR